MLFTSNKGSAGTNGKLGLALLALVVAACVGMLLAAKSLDVKGRNVVAHDVVSPDVMGQEAVAPRNQVENMMPRHRRPSWNSSSFGEQVQTVSDRMGAQREWLRLSTSIRQSTRGMC